jgi:hypothetical protein
VALQRILCSYIGQGRGRGITSAASVLFKALNPHRRLKVGRCHDGSISCCRGDWGRMVQRPEAAVVLASHRRRWFCSTKTIANAD